MVVGDFPDPAIIRKDVLIKITIRINVCMDITILILPKSLLEPDIVVIVQMINWLLVIGHAKIFGLEAKRQKIPNELKRDVDSEGKKT